jgi:2'-5' RNA ligase
LLSYYPAFAGFFIMDMYFIATVLPPHLNLAIRKYKEWMLEQYGCKVGLKSPAHITLVAPFWMNATLEELLKHTVDAACQTSLPFSIETANFSAFKPRTLFVAVEKNKELELLKRNVEDAMIAVSELGIKKENRPFHPHITIATRDLHKASFYDAWEYFGEKEFKERCTVEEVSILKHNSRSWDICHTATLKKEGHA